MRANLLALSICGALIALSSQSALSQGLPDIVWEADDHTHSAKGIAFAPDGSFVLSGSGYDECSVILWRASDGAPFGGFSVYPHDIMSVDAAPGAPLVAVGYIVTGYPPGGVAAVWDTDLEEELYTTGGCHVAFSSDGSMLASGGGGVNRYLSLTRVSDGSQRHSIYTGSYILDVAYAPDGQLVATAGSDNDIKLWDPATGRLIRTLTGHEDDVSAVAFSPDGTYLASGAGGWDDPGESSIKIWRVSDGELLDTLTGHGEWVIALAFSPDGDLLISSGRTGPTPKIKLWDVVTGEMIEYYDDSALEIDVSPDGQYFVYGRSGGDVVLARTGHSSGIGDPLGSGTPLMLAAPSPNPFRGETTLSFALESAGDVRLSIYDVSGRRVATLVSEPRSRGEHTVRWDGRDDRHREVPSGIYFARVDAGSSSVVGKLVVIR